MMSCWSLKLCMPARYICTACVGVLSGRRRKGVLGSWDLGSVMSLIWSAALCHGLKFTFQESDTEVGCNTTKENGTFAVSKDIPGIAASAVSVQRTEKTSTSTSHP